MNDTFNPIGLDLTKNLHGHVRVETRSKWTGKVIDSQEKDNMITSAVSQMAQLLPMQYSTSQASTPMLAPIFSNSLGGILLFDGALTESANNVALPSSVKLVGVAGQTSNTQSEFAGSYNAMESVATSNGFTTVWDFLTSQANGTIASLARTSKYFSNNPAYFSAPSSMGVTYINFANSMFPSVYAPRCLGYDRANNYMYVAGSGSTVDGITYPSTDIYRWKLSMSGLGLFGNLPPASAQTLIKRLTSSDGTTSANLYFYDEYANNFVYLTSNTLHKIAMDGTHSSVTLGGSGARFAVTENYYWRLNGGTVYRLLKTNPSSMETYSCPDSAYIASADNDMIFCVGGGKWNILYPDGETRTINSSTAISQSSSYDMRRIGSWLYNDLYVGGGTNLYWSTHYLGTIANLDSPVTKTSSQTMKITYTLTEA